MPPWRSWHCRRAYGVSCSYQRSTCCTTFSSTCCNPLLTQPGWKTPCCTAFSRTKTPSHRESVDASRQPATELLCPLINNQMIATMVVDVTICVEDILILGFLLLVLLVLLSYLQLIGFLVLLFRDWCCSSRSIEAPGGHRAAKGGF